MAWEYRCVATTVEGFVFQLAVCYLRNGYWFYVLGEIPPGKAPEEVDDKLVTRYGVGVSKWAKARARKRGEAKVQYLRYARTFLLLATHGDHRLFAEEQGVIRDVRERPIRFYGYSVGYRDGHPHVRIASDQYRELEAAYLERALSASPTRLGSSFHALPFEPYGPVKMQVRKLLRKVNRARKVAGLEAVPASCLRTMREPVRPFDTAAPGELRECGHSRREPEADSTGTGSDGPAGPDGE